MDIQTIVTIVTLLLGFAVGYGVLRTTVSGNRKDIDANKLAVEKVLEVHKQDVKEDMESLNHNLRLDIARQEERHSEAWNRLETPLSGHIKDGSDVLSRLAVIETIVKRIERNGNHKSD